MKKIISKFISWTLFLLSYNIIFAFTDDKNFGTVEIKNEFIKNIKTLRFSIINIMLGSKIIYIFTWNPIIKKWNLIYILSLEKSFDIRENQAIEKRENIEQLTEKYLSHLHEIDLKDVLLERESLCYRISNEEKRIDKSNQKINLYATVVLTLIPLLLTIINFNQLSYLDTIDKLIFIIIIYASVNIILFIFQAIKIQNVQRSTFSDLKKSTEYDKCINKQYYYDWQNLKLNADLFVSYTKNLQNWFIIAFISIIIGSFFDMYNNYNISNSQNSSLSEVKQINLNELNDVYSQSSVVLKELELKIQQKNVTRIIIISKDKSCTDEFVEQLNRQYKDLQIDFYKDDTSEINTIKIIEEE